MLNVVTCLWDVNDHTKWFSKCYDESWVIRLFDGFRRNLAMPFRPVLFTEKPRKLDKSILQIMLSTDRPGYGNFTEPYRLNEPMILCGLDTIVTGSCDELAHYCLRGNTPLLPRDPYRPERCCNGVALVPAGNSEIYEKWSGENDMEWLREQPHRFIDDIYPGRVESYKGHVKRNGLKDCRIVYFHGDEKPHQLLDKEPWIRQHWLG